MPRHWKVKIESYRAASNSLNPYNRHSDWHKLGSLCYKDVLNCDLFHFSDTHDKSTDHKRLKAENRVLRTQEFCGNAIFVETSTPQSAFIFPQGSYQKNHSSDLMGNGQ